MANFPTRNQSAYITAAKAAAEARASKLFDLNRRENADNILHPDEVGGDYDASRGLYTTLNGEPRAITIDDLKAFSRYVQNFKQKYHHGIKAKQVVDHSLGEDRERANMQIHSALPTSHHGDVVHFQTDASSASNVKRHHVYVQFMRYSEMVASPIEARKAAGFMQRGYLKFDCDCGRHTFWYRFMATIGQYNFGRDETGYPRVRNAKLKGVACKHVLRVMQLIMHSATFDNYATNMITVGRSSLERKKKITKKADMQKLEQELLKERGRNKKIKTTEEKREARNAEPKNLTRLQAKNIEIAKRTTEKAESKAFQKQYNELRNAYAMLVKYGQATPEQAAAQLAEFTKTNGGKK